MVSHGSFATPSNPFIPVIHVLNCMQTTMLAALLVKTLLIEHSLYCMQTTMLAALLVKTLLIENANAVCLLCRFWAGIREAWLSC